MLKKIKLKNSTILFVGIVFIILGISFGFYEYFVQRKNKAFSDMNIKLYENEIPINVTEENLVDDQERNPDDIEINENEPKEHPIENVYNYIGTLEIPKIHLKRGFLDLNSKYNNVDYNITIINGSTFPNEENNNLILAAHSGMCSVCFFDKLFNLSTGDFAYINFNNIRYEYRLVNTYEVDKIGTVPIHRDYDKNVLTLITCTRNSNTKQTVFIFELNK